jgi:hypothetical protein
VAFVYLQTSLAGHKFNDINELFEAVVELGIYEPSCMAVSIPTQAVSEQ